MNKIPKLVAVEVEFDENEKPKSYWFKKVEVVIDTDGSEFSRRDLPRDRVAIDSPEASEIRALLGGDTLVQLEALRADISAAEKAKAYVDTALAEEQRAHAETKALVAALETERTGLTDANASLGEQQRAAALALAVEQEAHAETKATLEAAAEPAKE